MTASKKKQQLSIQSHDAPQSIMTANGGKKMLMMVKKTLYMRLRMVAVSTQGRWRLAILICCCIGPR